MKKNGKLQLTVLLTFIAAVILFSFMYNAYVTKTVIDASYDDANILKGYNNEIIEKLIAADDISQWQSIVDSYPDLIIEIRNSSSRIVAETEEGTWTILDVKSQVPFQYNNEAYYIESSVYFLREHVADDRNLVTFLFIELSIGIAILSVFVFLIYILMLRPYRKFYRAIEQYDETGELKEIDIKGYAGLLYKRFFSLTKNLEKQQQHQRRIIASISHDIKTPLTSIMGYTERLKKDTISAEKRDRYLDTVYDKSIEIQQLVNEFDEYLSFNMSSSLRFEKYTVAEIEQSLKKDYADELENAGAIIVFDNRCSDACVMVDLSKFKRVCGNIFGNSLKHFNKKEKIIKVLFYCDKDKVYVEIHDNGRGVSEEMLEVIFEPLYTSDKGRKVAGLGLSICREIVSKHGGVIYARRSEYGGLAVCMEFEMADSFKTKNKKQIREV